jgi:predicted N-acyltransferase
LTLELRVLPGLGGLAPGAWDALHDGSNPFVSHAFLAGLEATGCLRPRWGWSPAHAALYDGQALVAAAPGYRKDNSHGEFVFDHAWAHAYERHGFSYYPKWLIGVPYSPVPGPRLLARDVPGRLALARALRAGTAAQGFSSAHINFLHDREHRELDLDDDERARWLARFDVQFHWENRGWRDWGDFLDAFTSKRRKAIRQEREKVQRAGFSFRVLHGDEATADDIAAMHGYYCMTFAEKGNSPALTPEFFAHLARAMPRALVLVLAYRGGRRVAGALCLRGGDTLYGRYWGSEDAAPGLHFEACYYQGIEYCLREGLQRFEPGAQGEHKLARGFLPVLTQSRHFIADPDFAEAIGGWCAQERESVTRYRGLMLQHSPFRDDDHAAPPRA